MKNIIETIFNILAPPPLPVREIERMALSEWRDRLRPGITDDGIRFLFPYSNQTVSAALIEIKTRRNPAIVRVFGSLLFECLEPYRKNRPIIMPIPVTPRRMRERGWNQCILILRELAKVDRGRHFETRSDILIKVRNTDDQVGKNRAERAQNIRGAFSVFDSKFLDRRDVVVFDDIVTTGATLREARNVLLHAGARTVFCIAIAH
ncbi:MAG TPA: hypothetical protein VFT82_03480 [Candidatus Paceibacterota bacterium]|nr:hypothetical protein [Candidatus Paceibacterota bacterium]